MARMDLAGLQDLKRACIHTHTHTYKHTDIQAAMHTHTHMHRDGK